MNIEGIKTSVRDFLTYYDIVSEPNEVPNFFFEDWEKYKFEKSNIDCIFDKEHLIFEKPIKFNEGVSALPDNDKKLLQEKIKELKEMINVTINNHLNYDYGTIVTLKEIVSSYLFNEKINIGSNFTLDVRKNLKSNSREYYKIRENAYIIKTLRKVFKLFNVEESKVLIQLVDEMATEKSKLINKTKEDAILCISVHPMDFLTASDNNTNWQSCFSFKENGDYKLGTLSAMVSNSTFIAYIKSKNTDYKYGYNKSWNNKTWRAWCHMNEESDLIISRHYPYYSQIVQDEVVKMISDISNIEFERSEFDCIYNSSLSVNSEFMYSDLEESDCQKYVYFNKKFIDKEDPYQTHYFYIDWGFSSFNDRNTNVIEYGRDYPSVFNLEKSKLVYCDSCEEWKTFEEFGDAEYCAECESSWENEDDDE